MAGAPFGIRDVRQWAIELSAADSDMCWFAEVHYPPVWNFQANNRWRELWEGSVELWTRSPQRCVEWRAASIFWVQFDCASGTRGPLNDTKDSDFIYNPLFPNGAFNYFLFLMKIFLENRRIVMLCNVRLVSCKTQVNAVAESVCLWIQSCDCLFKSILAGMHWQPAIKRTEGTSHSWIGTLLGVFLFLISCKQV